MNFTFRRPPFGAATTALPKKLACIFGHFHVLTSQSLLCMPTEATEENLGDIPNGSDIEFVELAVKIIAHKTTTEMHVHYIL